MTSDLASDRLLSPDPSPLLTIQGAAPRMSMSRGAASLVLGQHRLAPAGRFIWACSEVGGQLQRSAALTASTSSAAASSALPPRFARLGRPMCTWMAVLLAILDMEPSLPRYTPGGLARRSRRCRPPHQRDCLRRQPVGRIHELGQRNARLYPRRGRNTTTWSLISSSGMHSAMSRISSMASPRDCSLVVVMRPGTGSLAATRW